MRLDLTKIDPNLLAGTEIRRDDAAWLSVLEPPFSLHGLAVTEKDKFWRLPEWLIDHVNEGVSLLARHTAGGRIRFRTDSPFLAYRARLVNIDSYPMMPLSGSAGCDVFVNGVSHMTFRPNSAQQEWFEGFLNLPGGMKDVEIGLGLYGGTAEAYIGLGVGSTVEAPKPYAIGKPVVYYGSSITQGGCASKPGSSYQALLSRWLNADYVNLGFSGSGKGETNMAEYIASLDMSAFVLDYDHNAPAADHLRRTHRPFFEIIRKAHPDLPVIMMSRPDRLRSAEDTFARRQIIRETFESARAQGDRLVWFIDGQTLLGAEDWDSCTIDGTHPNDLGFYRMALCLLPVLREALRL